MVSHDGRCRVGGVMMVVVGLVSVVAGVVEVSINITDFHAARSILRRKKYTPLPIFMLMSHQLVVLCPTVIRVGHDYGLWTDRI